VWGATLTPTIVNDANFGVQIKCVCGTANVDVGVDYVQMAIEYTPPAFDPAPFFPAWRRRRDILRRL
jgi:hypothetical protein